MGLQRQAQELRADLGDFVCLIEAALAQPRRMQGHGEQAIRAWLRVDGTRQERAEQARERELMPVLQGLNQFIYRESVIERGMGAIERGRVLQAGAAYLAIAAGCGATRTGAGGGSRQISVARGAEQVRAASRAAQHTILLEQPPHKF